MGLAASQARLLNLTSRMHDIEYKAQKLEAQKLQMANESTQVYQEYEDALNLTKLQFKQIGTDGSANYVDATYDLLTQSGYYVSMLGTGFDGNANKIVISEADEELYDRVGSAEKFAAVKAGICEEKTVGGVAGITLADTNTICIFTVDDLKKHAGTNTEKILMNDLVVDTSDNYLASTLKGTFDGNGHTITVKGKSGIFNNLNGATIKNLNINMDINSNAASVGGLANKVNGNSRVENINLVGEIKNNSNSNTSIGALIGDVLNSYDLTANNITSNVNLTYTGTGTINIGGIVGQSGTGDLKVNNAIYNGIIEANNSTTARAGGIVGLVATNNIGTVNITDCKSSGRLSTNASTTPTSNGSGGIAGTVWSTTTTDRQKITNSYSTMDVSANTAAAGGIAGYAQVTINNCKATGTITGNENNSGQIRGTGNLGNNDNPQCNATGASTSVNQDFTTNSNYQYYLKTGKAIEENNYVAFGDHLNDAVWLSEMLNSAYILLSKTDSENNIYEVNVATDTSLQEVSDETLLKKAEAKYEADMRKINQKDKKFDTELAAMDAERNAIKTEMDTLKSIAKENVDRTFKLFG